MKRTWLDWSYDIALGAAVVVVLAALLSGCGGTMPVVPGRTAIPVECKEPIPARPAMPTENLPAGADLDAFTAAAIAELERREGYEGQLVTSLVACTKPVKRTP
jgi:hypothetical protein